MHDKNALSSVCEKLWSAIEAVIRSIKDSGGLTVFLRRTFPMNVGASPGRPWEEWNGLARECGFDKPVIEAEFQPSESSHPDRWRIRINHPGRHQPIELCRGHDFPVRLDPARQVEVIEYLRAWQSACDERSARHRENPDRKHVPAQDEVSLPDGVFDDAERSTFLLGKILLAQGPRAGLLRFLKNEADGMIAVADLPSEYREPDLLTMMDAEGLIEFGRRNHHWAGGNLVVENGWEFVSVIGPHKKPMPDFIAEAIDWKGDERIRPHVRLTDKGRVEASRLALAARPEADAQPKPWRPIDLRGTPDPATVDAVRRVIADWDGENWAAVRAVLEEAGQSDKRIESMTLMDVRMFFAVRQKPLTLKLGGRLETATSSIVGINVDEAHESVTQGAKPANSKAAGGRSKQGAEKWRRAQKRMLEMFRKDKLPAGLRQAATLLEAEGFRYNTVRDAAHKTATLRSHFNLSEAQNGASGSLLDELAAQADAQTRAFISRLTARERERTEDQLRGMDRQKALELVKTLATNPDAGSVGDVALIEGADEDADADWSD